MPPPPGHPLRGGPWGPPGWAKRLFEDHDAGTVPTPPVIHPARKNYCPGAPGAPADIRAAIAFIQNLLNGLIRANIFEQTGQDTFRVNPTGEAILKALGYTPVPEARKVQVGPGLSGGGPLTGDVTLFLPDTITAGTYAPATITVDRHGRIVGLGSAGAGGYAVWVKATKTYADFAIPGVLNTIPLFTLPEKALVLDVVVKHSVIFAGGAILSYLIDVGHTPLTERYVLDHDAFAAVSDGAHSIGNTGNTRTYHHSGTVVTATAQSGGGLLDAATQGIVEIAVLYAIVP